MYLSWGWAAVAIGGMVTLWGFFGWSLEPDDEGSSLMSTHPVAEALPPVAHPEGEHDVYRTRKTAMWVFLGSECLFFGAMISTFLLYRNTTEGGPGAEIFNIPFTSASSFVLLMSSLTMVLAAQRLRAQETAARAECGWWRPHCSAARSSPARSSSSPSSFTRD